MENLAKELVAQILGCLTPHDVLRVESVCRLWREISVTDHALWQKYYEKETGIVQKEKESTDRSAKRPKIDFREATVAWLKLFLPMFDIIGETLPIDEARVKQIERWEKTNKFTLPLAIRRFFSFRGIENMVQDTAPSKNYLPYIRDLELLHAPDGDVALPILNENQGCCFWYAKWDPNGTAAAQMDPQVIVSSNQLPSKEDEEKEEEEDEEMQYWDDIVVESEHFSSWWIKTIHEGVEEYNKTMPQYKSPRWGKWSQVS